MCDSNEEEATREATVVELLKDKLIAAQGTISNLEKSLASQQVEMAAEIKRLNDELDEVSFQPVLVLDETGSLGHPITVVMVSGMHRHTTNAAG